MENLRKSIYENYFNRLNITSYVKKIALEMADENNLEVVKIRENDNDYILMEFEKGENRYIAYIKIEKGLFVVDADKPKK